MATEPDTDLPDSLIEEVEQCTDQQLQELVKFAQNLHKRRHDPTKELRPRHENEEIVSIEDKGTYTLVIVEEVDGTDERVAYHVTYEPHLHDGNGGYNWRYLGPVAE